MRVCTYSRVSTVEQGTEGASLAAQAAAIDAAAHARGWEIVARFEDVASGKALEGREGLLAVLATVEAGEADALVVSKLDRLSRSLLDFASLMDRARRAGWGIVALDLGVDTSTPAGEMLASVLATFAQFERRIIGQRTKDALAIKRQQGVRLGRPREVSPALVDRIQDLHGALGTYSGVARALNLEGVLPPRGTRWYPSGIQRIVRWADAA